MASRAVKETALSFGLVHIPVKVYTATTESRVSFRTLHKDCLTPISMPRLCQKCQKEATETVKGYEISKGEFVSFTEEELASLPVVSAQAIEILGFLEQDLIDPLFFETPYVLAPTDDKKKRAIGLRAYTLFHQAMMKQDRDALAKISLREREHLAMVRPLENGSFVLWMLRWAEEVKDLNEFAVQDAPAISKEELKMAESLMESMFLDSFDPENFKDEYRDAVERAVQGKIKGQQFAASRPDMTLTAEDALMDMMKKALADKQVRK